MKKLLLFLLFFNSIHLFAQVSVRVSPQFAMEGIITDKKTKEPMVNESFTVYAFGQVWDIYTGSYGDYIIKFYEPGKDFPSTEKPGEETITFVYGKRKFSIPVKSIEFDPNGSDGPPVVKRDVKL